MVDKTIQPLPIDLFKLFADPLLLVNLVRFEINAVQRTPDRDPAMLAAADAADQPAQRRTGSLPFPLMTINALRHDG